MPAGSTNLGQAGCPKHMVHGPCGGVNPDRSCELGDRRCSFVDLPLTGWPADRPPASPVLLPAAAAMRDLLRTRQLVVADFPATALDVDSLRECADLLAGKVDAVLLGDSGSARVQLPPALRAQLVQRQGVAAWAGLNCRDRNRVALQGELAGLAAVGVAGVHCVTGDHPAVGHRPDATAVFDLDSTRLAALAASMGHLVSVAESPSTPPASLRPARLVDKIAAGAQVCFVNHCGPAARVAEFVRTVSDLAAAPAFIACVPLVVDQGSAELLRSFTSLVLPPGYLDRIIASADPYRAGIEAAVELSMSMLSIGGVRGVNLSGGPAPGGEAHFAGALALVGAALR